MGAEHNLEEMNKCCGLFNLPWKRWKRFDQHAAYKDAYDAKRVAKREKAAMGDAEKAAAAAEQKGTPKQQQQRQSGQMVQKVLGNEDEEEMEAKQNVQIEHITVKGEANEIGLAQNQH